MWCGVRFWNLYNFCPDLISEHLVILFLVVYRTMIQNMIKEGKIVPSEVTIKLLQKAMQDSGNDKFLIDGFPRNEENRAAFEAVVSFLHNFLYQYFPHRLFPIDCS
jgi:hypothetical protein